MTDLHLRLHRAHYVLQRHLYFTDELDVAQARVVLADGIAEPQWNHATLSQAPAVGAVDEVIERVEHAFRSRGLCPAWELATSRAAVQSDLARRLAARGYQQRYRYAWLVHDADAADHGQRDPDDVAIRDAVSASEREAFWSVFQAVYGEDLDAGYRRALCAEPRDRVQSSQATCRVDHHVAWQRGEPLAVASSIHCRVGDCAKITGLYNLAVHPGHRRRGLGQLLTRHRVRRARELGQRHVFLQTERRPVGTWQQRHGFRLAFATEGLVQPTLSNP